MSIKRRSILTVSFIFVALTMSSCGGSSDSIELTPEAAEAETATTDLAMVTGDCANPYFPVLVNANWAYDATGSEVEPYSFTSTVSEVFPDSFTLTHQFDDLTLTQQWECKPEGLVALELGGGTAASLVTGDVDLKLETSNINGVTFPSAVSVGDEWTHSMDVSGEIELGEGMFGSMEGQAISNFQAVDMENVEVPAGSFEALRVATEFTLDMTVTVEGTSIPVIFTSTGSSWHVPNIGWVKQTSETTIFEVPTTDTIELAAFSLP